MRPSAVYGPAMGILICFSDRPAPESGRMQVITAQDRKLAAEKILSVIEGLESVLDPRRRDFINQMRRAQRVSVDQLRWLASIKEECLGS